MRRGENKFYSNIYTDIFVCPRSVRPASPGPGPPGFAAAPIGLLGAARRGAAEGFSRAGPPETRFYSAVPPCAPSPPRRCCRGAAWSPPPNPRAAPRRTPSPAVSSSRSRNEPGTPRSRPRAWARRLRSARRSDRHGPAPPPPAPSRSARPGARPPSAAAAAPGRGPREEPPAPHLPAPPAATQGEEGWKGGTKRFVDCCRLRFPTNPAFGPAASPAPAPPLLSAPAGRCAPAPAVRRPRGARRRTLDPTFTSARCLKPCGAPSYSKTAFYDQFY